MLVCFFPVSQDQRFLEQQICSVAILGIQRMRSIKNLVGSFIFAQRVERSTQQCVGSEKIRAQRRRPLEGCASLVIPLQPKIRQPQVMLYFIRIRIKLCRFFERRHGLGVMTVPAIKQPEGCELVWIPQVKEPLAVGLRFGKRTGFEAWLHATAWREA